MEFTGNPQQPVWRALFHPTRRQIIRLLQEKSRTTGELSNFFDVTRYAVMKHLRVLEQADLIHVRREGRLRWNVLNPVRLQEVPTEYLEKWRSQGQEPDEKSDLMDIEAGVTTLAYEITLPVSAECVYRAFLDGINAWWPGRTEDGSTLIFEPFVGGRFYEATQDEGAGVLIGFVTCLRPFKEIRLLGPMDSIEEAALSTVRIRLEEEDGRTRLHLTHHTTGEVDNSLIPLYINDWEERLDHHLRNFVTE
ncbi:MAG: metalloregulator ArsR/SmtB family transcription factor [Candidatus Promineifilaceae bacterium]